MKKTNKTTPAYAASQIITRVKRKIRRMQKEGNMSFQGDQLIDWLDEWNERMKNAEGGWDEK